MESYTNQIVINRPRKQVVHIFTDSAHYPEWQPNLVAFDVYEGGDLQTGTKARLEYNFGDHDKLVAHFRVKENKLPDSIKIDYDSDGVQNYQTVRFQALTESRTLVIIDSEYDMEGLMKIMKVLNPKHFHKRTQEYLEQYKKYAESR